MDSQQYGIQEDTTCRVDSTCGCNVGDEGDDDDDTANTASSSINVDNIEIEGTCTICSIVRACDTDVPYQNRNDDLDLAKIAKAIIAFKL